MSARLLNRLVCFFGIVSAIFSAHGWVTVDSRRSLLGSAIASHPELRHMLESYHDDMASHFLGVVVACLIVAVSFALEVTYFKRRST